MIKYWAFRLAAAVVPLVPRRIAYAVSQAVGLALWALLPGARRQVAANLLHIPSLASDPEQRHWAVRGVFRHIALNYVDAFRAHRLSAAEIMAGWDVDGQEQFDAAVAAGRGVIVLGAHLGNFEHGGARLAAMGYPVLVPAERIKPERLFQLLSQLRSHHGVRLVPADSTQALRDLYAALRRGEVVVLFADRDVLGTGVSIPFFGEPARLPTGPVLLARRSGASVIGAFSWRNGFGRSGGLLVPLHLPGVAGGSPGPGSLDQSDPPLGALPPRPARLRGADAIAQALEPVVRMLEEQITAHPQQWVAAFTPIWSEPSSVQGGGAA
jgi:phosphatidylinositol dimannoside acyltransferase